MRRLLYWAIGGILVCSMIIACDAKDDILKSNNGSLAGTKWIGSNMDYLIGDDWITLYDESMIWYFYSDTKGMLYYVQKKNDSDDGYSSYSNIKYIDNQLVTVIKIQMICKCKYKTI